MDENPLPPASETDEDLLGDSPTSGSPTDKTPAPTETAVMPEDQNELQQTRDALAETQRQLEETRAIARRHTVLAAMRNAGRQLQVALNEDALGDLYDAGHLQDVETGDDAEASNADDFLKALIKARPYVLQTKAPAPDIGAERGGIGAGELLSDDDYHYRARRFGIELPGRP